MSPETPLRKTLRSRGSVLTALLTLVFVLAFSAVAQARVCVPVKFVGAAGSGQRNGDQINQHHGFGDLLDAYYNQLTTGNGVSQGLVEPVAVQYPATAVGFSLGGFGLSSIDSLALLDAATFAVPTNPYWSSVEDGSKWLLDYVAKQATGPCRGKTRLILGGYSQGAAVVHMALAAMPAKFRNVIASVVVYGDPFFSHSEDTYGTYNPLETGGSVPPAAESFVLKLVKWPSGIPAFSFCNANDPVCNAYRPVFGYAGGPKVWNGNINISQHLLAAYDSLGNIKVGAIFVANTTKIKDLSTTGIGADSRKGPTDMVFAIDTTGSMSNVLYSLTQAVARMTTQLSQTSPDFRVGLVEYKDYDASGGFPDAFQSHVDVPLTSDLTQFGAALDNLVADGGGDTPESVYSGLNSGMDIGFRPGSKRSVVVIGDAEAKDPEPLTGFTAQTMINKALGIGSFQVFGIFSRAVGDDYSLAGIQSIVDATGGKMYTLTAPDEYAVLTSALAGKSTGASANARPMQPRGLVSALEYDPTDDVVNAVVDAVRAAGVTPRISVAAPIQTRVGAPTPISSTIASGEVPTSIDWDLDGDGAFEQIGVARNAVFAPAAAGVLNVKARYTLSDGVVAIGSAQITVNSPLTKVKSKRLIGKLKIGSIRNTRKGSIVRITYVKKASQPVLTIVVLNKRHRVVTSVHPWQIKAKKTTLKLKIPKSAAKRGTFTIQGSTYLFVNDLLVQTQMKKLGAFKKRH